mmetsp:Transcript_70330/g.197221  ORF Transcript_70330/g.197221 Transcript_70330/m.197221 type:complete len:617 (-) Transcript_70330:869-2719(-)
MVIHARCLELALSLPDLLHQALQLLRGHGRRGHLYVELVLVDCSLRDLLHLVLERHIADVRVRDVPAREHLRHRGVMDLDQRGVARHVLDGAQAEEGHATSGGVGADVQSPWRVIPQRVVLLDGFPSLALLPRPLRLPPLRDLHFVRRQLDEGAALAVGGEMGRVFDAPPNAVALRSVPGELRHRHLPQSFAVPRAVVLRRPGGVDVCAIRLRGPHGRQQEVSRQNLLLALEMAIPEKVEEDGGKRLEQVHALSPPLVSAMSVGELATEEEALVKAERPLEVLEVQLVFALAPFEAAVRRVQHRLPILLQLLQDILRRVLRPQQIQQLPPRVLAAELALGVRHIAAGLHAHVRRLLPDEHQWRQAGVVHLPWLRSELQQRAHDADLQPRCGVVERGGAAGVLEVGVGPAAEEHLRRLELARRDDVHQRRDALQRRPIRIGLGARRQGCARERSFEQLFRALGEKAARRDGRGVLLQEHGREDVVLLVLHLLHDALPLLAMVELLVQLLDHDVAHVLTRRPQEAVSDPRLLAVAMLQHAVQHGLVLHEGRKAEGRPLAEGHLAALPKRIGACSHQGVDRPGDRLAVARRGRQREADDGRVASVEGVVQSRVGVGLLR